MSGMKNEWFRLDVDAMNSAGSVIRSSLASGMESSLLYSLLNMPQTTPPHGVLNPGTASYETSLLASLLHSFYQPPAPAVPSPSLSSLSPLEALLLASTLPATQQPHIEAKQSDLDSVLLSLLLLSNSATPTTAVHTGSSLCQQGSQGGRVVHRQEGSLSSSSPYSRNSTPSVEAKPVETGHAHLATISENRGGGTGDGTTDSCKSRKRKPHHTEERVPPIKAKRPKGVKRRTFSLHDAETNSPVSGMFIKVIVLPTPPSLPLMVVG